ncbi:unnamed protein product [Arctia plantaginis]|uniref:E3 ubiquitin-protein ligase Topors n=1 Tax=Arctia plantaginis TaxID=874455 RepID=A0A8S1A2A4_ARCPL|nr:unnamed protein product [Arctia plantaginis]
MKPTASSLVTSQFTRNLSRSHVLSLYNWAMDTLSTTAQDDSSGANPSSVKSDDSSPQRESGAGSPPPNCAICLGTCRNKSFTDSCLHQFCFSCLLTWSKVKAECPLCKQAFRSIIHNVRSNHQYEEYLVVQRQTEESSSRIDIDRVTAATHRFRYRTTLTLPRRETIAIQQLLRHYPFMADVFPPAVRAPPARRRRSPASFRRTVYRHNLWARPLPDFTGRFRDCSPDFYSYNNTQMHRLVPWLNRELHYLLNENVGHISYVIARILELLPQYHISSVEFREAMQRYFGDRTEHFLHELYCFASTPYDMAGYDRNVQYTTDTRISTMVNEVISSSDSEATVDSDIVMISSSGPADPPPGPSRVPAPVYPQSFISQPTTSNSIIPIETISQSDTDDDSSEVMVVGYIKPPQDRTPEIVDLLGSDSDVIVQENTDPPTNPVKVTLKRHRVRDSESDSSFVLSPPRRRRRRRSDDSTTSDMSRSTPEKDPERRSMPLYLKSTTESEFSSTDDEPRPKNKNKKRSRTAAKDRRRNDKRPAQTHHKESKNEANLETDKRNGRKSLSGKGVKSSNKNSTLPPDQSVPDARSRSVGALSDRATSRERSPLRTPERPLVPERISPEPSTSALDQPSTSSMMTNQKRKSSKERKQRRRQSRENRRLKSVVNVIHSSHRNTEESNSSAYYSNIPSVSVTTDNFMSDSESVPGVSDARSDRAEESSNSPRPNILTSLETKQAHSSSDSEDNLPLNLTLQKKTPPALT